MPGDICGPLLRPEIVAEENHVDVGADEPEKSFQILQMNFDQTVQEGLGTLSGSAAIIMRKRSIR